MDGDRTPVLIQGENYEATRWTLDIQRVFRHYLQDKAAEHLKEMLRSGKLSPQERREAWSSLQRDCASGEYAFGSQTWLAALTNDPMALAKLLWLQLQGAHPDLREKTVQDWCMDMETRVECLGAVMEANPQLRQKSPTESSPTSGAMKIDSTDYLSNDMA